MADRTCVGGLQAYHMKLAKFHEKLSCLLEEAKTDKVNIKIF